MDFKLQELPIQNLKPDKEQPRQDYKGIEEFANSLKNNLIEYPLLIEDLGNSSYLILDGHRRYYASSKAGLKKLWCKVYPKLTPLQRLELRVNLEQHKDNWKISERDKAWQEMFNLIIKENSKFTRADFAKRLGVGWDTVNDAFDRLSLGLPEQIWDKLPASFIHETLGLEKEARIKILKQALKEGWSRDKIRQEVKDLKLIQNKNFEEIKKAFIQQGFDETTAQYKAEQLFYAPAKLEHFDLNANTQAGKGIPIYFFVNKNQFNIIQKKWKLVYQFKQHRVAGSVVDHFIEAILKNE